MLFMEINIIIIIILNIANISTEIILVHFILFL